MLQGAVESVATETGAKLVIPAKTNLAVQRVVARCWEAEVNIAASLAAVPHPDDITQALLRVPWSSTRCRPVKLPAWRAERASANIMVSLNCRFKSLTGDNSCRYGLSSGCQTVFKLPKQSAINLTLGG